MQAGNESPSDQGAGAQRRLAGTAHLPDRRKNARGCVCCLAPTHRRSLRPENPDFVCASKPQRMRRTASRTPGTLLAGFTPAEVWRSGGRV